MSVASYLFLVLIPVSISFSSASQSSARRGKAIHEIYLSDPLDCLSQLVCGLNTFPPIAPGRATTTANDYAYLLHQVLLRLRKQRVKPTPLPIPSTTTTTTLTPPLSDDESTNEEESVEEEEEEDLTPEEKRKKILLKNSKDQNADIVEMKGLYPPFGIVDMYKEQKFRRGRINRDPRQAIKKKKNKKIADTASSSSTTPNVNPLLQQLLREQDLRVKLQSRAQCLTGIYGISSSGYTCPFKYTELLILMSAILERQRVISHSSSKILPMVGYLLKSRSLTETLKASFFALERINNITLIRNEAKESVTFSHIYDEVVRGDFGGNGIHIIETKNEASGTHNIFEDDEFDAALLNPFLPKEKIPGYAIKDRAKKKKEQSGLSDDEESEEEEEEDEGVVIPPPDAGPFLIGDIAGFLSSQDSQEHSDESSVEKVESQKDIPLPPVYGGGRKNGQKFRRLKSRGKL